QSRLEGRKMTRILHQSARLYCDSHSAFEMFTVNEKLRSWLAPEAEVEPFKGGRFELFWEPENRAENSTLDCKVTALEPDQFIAFDWKGPTQFKHFMNNADPLTHVVVFFARAEENGTACADVH